MICDKKRKKPVVLVVEDHIRTIPLLKAILKKENWEIAVAKDGREAIEKVNNIYPDLILMDVMMPELNGFEACKIIKDNPETKDIPVIFLTVINQMEDIVKGFETGGVDYITKPFNHRELLARVRHHMELKLAKDSIKEKNKELEKSNKELKKLNKLKNNFLKIVSHDIRYPISAIISFSSLLLTKKLGNSLNKNQKDIIQIIKDTAEKHLTYSRDLLELALQEQEELILKFEKVQIKKLIDQSIESNKFFAEKKNVILINNVSKDMIIKVDGNKIFQVFNNILDNAIKFTPPDGKVEITSTQKNGSSLIKIKDNGTGMTEKKIQELMSDGKIYSTQGTENELGTGLGIKICRKILEAHNGKIFISAKEGDGCEVSLKF